MHRNFISLLQLLDNPEHRLHRQTLLGSIIIGLLLRLYSLYAGDAYTYFAINDEVSALQYGLGLLAGDPKMLYLGQPALNAGQVPGPLWAAFVALLYLLGGQTATGALLVMALVNTLVIYLVYHLAMQLLPARYALLSTLLYALSPWVVYYAVGLYNPIPLALLGVLLYLTLWQTLQQPATRSIFWLVAIAAVIPQFHMIGIFYLPTILLLLYLSPNRINWRWFSMGCVVGLLFYLPYVVGDYLNHWHNTRALLQGDKGFSFGILKVITIPIAMLANHPGEWAGYSFDEFKQFANQFFGSYIVLIIINLVAITIAATFIFSLLRRSITCLRQSEFGIKTCYRQQPIVMFIAIMLFVPLLTYVLTGRAYTTRYSIMIFPLLFLLPSLFLMHLNRPKLKTSMLYSLFILAAINVYIMLGFYHDLGKRIQSGDILMPSFARLQDIYRVLDEKAGNQPFEINTEAYVDEDNRYTHKAAFALKVYVDSQQQYVTQSPAQTGKKYYRLLGRKEVTPNHQDVVYRDHSITIVEQ